MDTAADAASTAPPTTWDYVKSYGGTALMIVAMIAVYTPHRDLYQRMTVIVTVGALAGVIRWFVILIRTNAVTRGDAVAFTLIAAFLFYVGYCQLTLPICTVCDKPTFLNGWIWKLLDLVHRTNSVHPV